MSGHLEDTCRWEVLLSPDNTALGPRAHLLCKGGLAILQKSGPHASTPFTQRPGPSPPGFPQTAGHTGPWAGPRVCPGGSVALFATRDALPGTHRFPIHLPTPIVGRAAGLGLQPRGGAIAPQMCLKHPECSEEPPPSRRLAEQQEGRRPVPQNHEIWMTGHFKGLIPHPDLPDPACTPPGTGSSPPPTRPPRKRALLWAESILQKLGVAGVAVRGHGDQRIQDLKGRAFGKPPEKLTM